MAWTKSSEGERDNGQYTVYSQDLTPKQVGSAIEGENWSSVIDFVPPGKNFKVIANTDATNLSASTHVELHTGWSRSATAASGRTESRVTPFLPVTAEIDTAQVQLNRVVATHGEWPYYWLKMSGGGNVTVKVIVYDPA